jgi:uncharacterized repeat protein (TIGR03803 family)
MSKLSLWRTISFVCVFCAVEAIGSQAQTFKTLLSFNGGDGRYPFYESLVQGPDGNFYGTTVAGGANCARPHCGTVFKITPAGKLTTIYSFCTQPGCADGNDPYAGLVQATDGNFYGTTTGGGANCAIPGNCATVFKITPAGTLTTLYTFCSKTNCPDGNDPYAGLVQATDGNFYGATNAGGPKNLGTVFKITPGAR